MLKRSISDLGHLLYCYTKFFVTIQHKLAEQLHLLLGYSKLFTGKFVKNQRPGIFPDLFYAQYNFRFQSKLTTSSL